MADLLEEKGLISADERDAIREDPANKDAAPSNGAGSGKEGPADGKKVGGEGAANPEAARTTVSVGTKGLSTTSAAREFQVAVGGRLQVDGGAFIDAKTSLGDGAERRRARIKSYGYVSSLWQYKLEVDFDPNLKVPVTGGWLHYNGFKPASITIGHRKVPFSQQSMTSSNWQVFRERGLPDAFIDNKENGRRRLGIVLGDYGDHWNIQGGVFARAWRQPATTARISSLPRVASGHRSPWRGGF